ncbi:MAG: FtsX-like permease family protein [Lachnospiraceae bacterium]|nr:FtsX-like permease family protein [Lachnospiraceae bacterium]
MNLLFSYTRKTLAQNKMRTVITVIGILLASAMLFAVTSCITSALEYFKNREIESSGTWHAAVYDLDAETLEAISQEEDVTATTVLAKVGYAAVDSVNDYKPYLYIATLTSSDETLIALNLIEGRMPENDSELVISAHLSSNGGVEWKVGDTVTLEVGDRYWEDTWLTQQDGLYVKNDVDEGESSVVLEELTNTVTKTYTIVGICERLDTTAEPYSAPGYTAITGTAEASTSFCGDLFLTFTSPANAYTLIAELMEKYRLTTVMEHSSLLRLYGVANGAGDSLVLLMWSLGAILIAIIMFGSVGMIYNVFSISVSERTKQFGILKSVGATGRQIRGSVFFEALMVSIIGIPLGMLAGALGIGVTFYFLQDALNLVIASGTGVSFDLYITPAGVAVTVFTCILTVLISAWIPARKAMKLTAMEAIRQKDDFKLGAKDVKTGRLTAKLFGFEGTLAAKNYRRSRKKYRATIVSLCVSVILFITAGSFSHYLSASFTDSIQVAGYDYRYYVENGVLEDAEEIYAVLRSADAITDSALTVSLTGYNIEVPMSVLSFPHSDDETTRVGASYGRIVFVEDDVYRSYLEENGFDTEVYMGDEPAALLYDELYSTSGTYSIYDVSSLPIRLSTQFYGLDEDDELYMVGEFTVNIAGKTEVQPLFQVEDVMFLYPLSYLTDGLAELDEDADSSNMTGNGSGSSEKTTDSAGAISESSAETGDASDKATDPTAETDDTSADTTDTATEELKALSVSELYETGYAQIYLYFASSDTDASTASLNKIIEENELYNGLYIYAEDAETARSLLLIINVFSFGFIILISLIAMANVFHSISTNIMLRRREFAMLRSVGMTKRGLNRMMNYECLLYGIRSLLIGLPIAMVFSYGIYIVTLDAVGSTSFTVPWFSIAVAVVSVFVVVFATMIYSMRRIRKENIMDELRRDSH